MQTRHVFELCSRYHTPGLRQILPGQVEDCNQFTSQYFSIFEALRVENDLSNELIVRPAHGHRPEQLL